MIHYVRNSVHLRRIEMTTFTATKARQNLFDLLKKSANGHVPIRITSKNGGVVMMSEEDYDSLMETLELVSEPSMARSIKQARLDIKAGRTKSLKEIFGK